MIFIRKKKEELKDKKDKAIAMILALFEKECKSLPEVHRALQEKLRKCANEITEQKFKMLDKQTTLSFRQRAFEFLFHREESVDKFILRGMLSDLEVTGLALDFLEREAGREFLKHGKGFNPFQS